jgi:hypothetical protein
MDMKKVNNLVNTLIGIWFMSAPWVLNFSDQAGPVTTSIVIGLILALSSLLSFKAGGWNLISLLAGVWFIVFPHLYELDTLEKWVSVVLGALVVILNLWNE